MRALKFLMGSAVLALAASQAMAADDGTFTINIQGPSDSAATVSQSGNESFQEAPLPLRSTQATPRRNTAARSTSQTTSAPRSAQTRQSSAAAAAAPRARTAQNATPRDAAAAQSEAAVQSTAARSAAPTQRAQASQTAAAVGNNPASQPAAAPQISYAPAQGSRIYSVKTSDTLWSVATRYLPADRSVNEFQIVAAIYRTNPGAFGGGNVNRLRAGNIVIPPLSEISREDPQTGSRLLSLGTMTLPPLAAPAVTATAVPASAPEASSASEAAAQESESADGQSAAADPQKSAEQLPEFEATESVISDARKQRQEEQEAQDAKALSQSMGSESNRSIKGDEQAATAAADAAKAAADGAKVLGLGDEGHGFVQNPQDNDAAQSEPLARLDNDTIRVMLQGSQKQIELKMQQVDKKLMDTIERMQKANETVTSSSDAAVAALAKQYDSIIAGLQQTVTELKGQLAALDRDNTNMREMLLASDEKLEALQVKLADGKVGAGDGGDYQRSLIMILVGIGLLTLLLLMLFVIFKIKSRARNRSVEKELAEDYLDTKDLEDDTLLSNSISSDGDGELSQDSQEGGEARDAWDKAAAAAAAEDSASSNEPPEDPDDSKTAMEMWSKAINEKKGESKTAEIKSGAEDTPAAENGDTAAGESAPGGADSAESPAEDTAAETQSDAAGMDDWAAALAEQEAAASGIQTSSGSGEAVEEADDEPAVSADERSSGINEIPEPQITNEVPQAEQDLSQYIGDSGSEWVNEMDEKEPVPEPEPERAPEPSPEEIAAREEAKRRQEQLDEDLKQYLGGSGSEWARTVGDAKAQEKITGIESEDVIAQVRSESGDDSGEAAALSQALKDHAVPKTEASADSPVAADAQITGSADEDELFERMFKSNSSDYETPAGDSLEPEKKASDPNDVDALLDEIAGGAAGESAAVQSEAAAVPEAAEKPEPENMEQAAAQVAGDHPDDLLAQVQQEPETNGNAADEVQTLQNESASAAEPEAEIPANAEASPMEHPEPELSAVLERAEPDEILAAAAMPPAGVEARETSENAGEGDESVAEAAEPAIETGLPAEPEPGAEQDESFAEESQSVSQEISGAAESGDTAAASVLQEEAEPQAVLEESVSELSGEGPAEESSAGMAEQEIAPVAAVEELPSEALPEAELPAQAVQDHEETLDPESAEAADAAHLAQMLAETSDEVAGDGSAEPEEASEAAAASEMDDAGGDHAGAASSEDTDYEVDEASAGAADEPEFNPEETEEPESSVYSGGVDLPDDVVELSSDAGAAGDVTYSQPENITAGGIPEEEPQTESEPAAADDPAEMDDTAADESGDADANASDFADLLSEAQDEQLHGEPEVSGSADTDADADATLGIGAMLAENTADGALEAGDRAEPELDFETMLSEPAEEPEDRVSSDEEPEDAVAPEDDAAEADGGIPEDGALSVAETVPEEEHAASPSEEIPDATGEMESEGAAADAQDAADAESEQAVAEDDPGFGTPGTAVDESPDVSVSEAPELGDTAPSEDESGFAESEIPPEDSWERLESAAGTDDEAADLKPFRWKIPDDDGFDGVTDPSLSPAAAQAQADDGASLMSMLGDSAAQPEIKDESGAGELSDDELLSMISRESSGGHDDPGLQPPAPEGKVQEQEELSDEEYRYLSDSLGLARLYFETGDLEEARKILELVEKRGNLNLKEDARALREEYDRF